ncbi:MAG TPA: NAD(P)-binding domain-containing protein [Miltoncostaeaceae bacterium]|nr:NAD(P)-binding domain-containing protein [Miltoncostaeaceae bacterium]
MPHVPVVVVGAGHCGLATSRHLAARSIDHVVLERGEVANSWRTERWDSLRLLTPNWLSRLPGQAYAGDDPDGYMTVREVVEYITAYAADAPVRTNTTVRTVRQSGAGFLVETDDGSWTADAVVVASGACNAPSLPAVSAELPADVPSLTAWGYRNPDQVPEGGVLVVGAAASGIQIADELLRAGRDVTVAVGEHVRVPRRYRGADILWWMEEAGVLGEPWTEMDDLVRARSIPSMQLTGGGGTLDLNALTARGARLVGRLQTIRDRRLLFSGSLRNVCALADLKLERLLDTLDAWALETGVDAPPPERFPRTAVPDDPVTELDLARDGIRSVLWATGYRAELSWLEAPVLNPRGRLIHDGGVTRVPGLYLMGMPFLRRRKSTLIDGADADARDLTEHLAAHLDAVVRGEGVAAAG